MSEKRSDLILERYRQAYRACHGTDPVITRHGGWYRVNGGSSAFRLSQLEELAANLERRLREMQERESGDE